MSEITLLTVASLQELILSQAQNAIQKHIKEIATVFRITGEITAIPPTEYSKNYNVSLYDAESGKTISLIIPVAMINTKQLKVNHLTYLKIKLSY